MPILTQPHALATELPASTGLKLRARILADDTTSLKLSFGERGTIDFPKTAVLSLTPDLGTDDHVIEIALGSKLQLTAATPSGEKIGIIDNSIFSGSGETFDAESGDCQCECVEGNACECCNDCDCDCDAEKHNQNWPAPMATTFRTTHAVTQP